MADTIDHDGGDELQRARLALMRHLGGDPAAVHAALETFEGVYPTLGAYVRRELEEHLPRFLEWIPDYLALDAVGKWWIDSRRNWTLPDRTTGGVLVFLAGDPLHPPDE